MYLAFEANAIFVIGIFSTRDEINRNLQTTKIDHRHFCVLLNHKTVLSMSLAMISTETNKIEEMARFIMFFEVQKTSEQSIKNHMQVKHVSLFMNQQLRYLGSLILTKVVLTLKKNNNINFIRSF